jgi:hypothetical protein
MTKKTRKPKQPTVEVSKCIVDPFSKPASEYDRFEDTLRRLLQVPKSAIDAQLKREKRSR